MALGVFAIATGAPASDFVGNGWHRALHRASSTRVCYRHDDRVPRDRIFAARSCRRSGPDDDAQLCNDLSASDRAAGSVVLAHAAALPGRAEHAIPRPDPTRVRRAQAADQWRQEEGRFNRCSYNRAVRAANPLGPAWDAGKW